MNPSSHILRFACFASLVLCAGCSESKTPTPTVAPASAPSSAASPNPVPAGPTKFGTTTVTWNTGDGSIGEVYVSVNGNPEKLFAGNRTKGLLDAPSIGKGDHEFRLHAGKEHKTVLASVKVTRSKQ